MNKPDSFKKYSPALLRIGLSVVFLWFGLSQLINPESFIGYIPVWLHDHPDNMVHEHPFQSAHSLPLTPHIVIMGNGVFETLLGALLLIGIFTRLAALLLSLHLFGIMLSLGYNDIAVRDFGLAVAALSVFLHGHDSWCLDKKRINQPEQLISKSS